MATEEQLATRKRPRRSRRDIGRIFARLLCVVFALVGAIPMGGGLLLRSEPLQQWAANETSRIIRQELGMEASFSVEMSLIPLRLAITDLKVPAIDGGSPAVEAQLAAVSPRFFSLLAGRIDVGDIELEDTSVRLVFEDGEIKNVAYRFPQTETGQRPELTRAPFRSLAVTNATVDIDVDGTRIQTDGIDIDAFAEENLSFDVALRAGGATVASERALNEEGTETSFDEDRLCALDVRMFLSKEQVVLRRLSLLGALDLDPKKNSNPECGTEGPERVAVRLSQVKVKPKEQGPPDVRGHLLVRLPLALADRASPTLRGTGWAGFTGDIAMGGDSKLPEVTGQLTGEAMSLSGYAIAEKLNAQVLVTGDVVQVPTLYAKWGNGEANLEGLKVEPFVEKVPLSIEKIVTKDIDFPGVMRDVDVTEHSWVEWNFGDTVIKKVGGTIVPFYLDGGVEAQTRDLVVWDKGFDDPTHKYMVGLKRANVDGRWRAHAKALEFYDADVTFGESSLPVDLVRIGFRKSGLVVRLKEEGGQLDLADVSPIANVELSGKSELYVNLEGPNLHPILKGTLEVDDLVVGGFEAGDVERSNIHFEPLFVEFTELTGQKGAMDYYLPAARLDFGGPASVEFTTAVSSQNFDVVEFFDTFQFDEDPRFADISGSGTVNGQVRYLLGGPEDTCPEGRLMVSGSADLRKTEFFGEEYSSGNAQFHFEWFDMEASTNGMRVEVPSLALRKGSGSIFGSVHVHPGGVLSGDFVGTQVPVSRVDTLGDLMGQADGFVTGVGQLDGTVESLAFSADVNVTPIKAGNSTLPASNLRVKLVPAEGPSAEETKVGTTSCGRAIPPEFTLADYERDESEGNFIINGELFGGQVRFEDLSISRQNKKVVKGRASLNQLDLGAMSAFAASGMVDSLPGGSVTGEVDLGEFFLDDPYGSTAHVTLKEAALSINDLRVDLADQQAKIFLGEGKVRTDNLALRTRTGSGQNGILDAEITVDRKNHIDATFDLRPTDLAVIAAAVPGVARAEGDLSASFALKGPIAGPGISGFIEVEEGKLNLDGFSSPVDDLFVTVALDQSGLHVEKGEAKWGGGTVALKGEAPLVRGELGRTGLDIIARNVTLPLEEDVRLGFDADLSLDVPAPSDESGELPRLSGAVDILSASYEKPMSITADISTLASRGDKTVVEGYDEAKDKMRLDVLLRSNKPLRVENDLVVSTLMIDPAGLRLTGTNQRFGAVGTVEVEKGGRVFLRRNEFEVQRGLVRFNDPTRLRPEVDVTAVTEYRRYQDRGANQEGGEQQQGAENTGAVAGNWRIMLHAYGPPDELKVDLNSDPPLAQDDIFLLLTVGLTRTELDQMENTGVGSSVALEALGSLSGAESAVTKTVPVDEFRFGSSYSSRSGRTEPTVTIGKRLSRRIRASVTTSLSDSSEVRSNIEYRATDSLSVEGSYDNAGDVASAAGGNLGGDVRWRLEFQ